MSITMSRRAKRLWSTLTTRERLSGQGGRHTEYVSDEEPRKNLGLAEIMKPAVSVSPETPAREVHKILRENGLSGVPVVNEDGTLEGFITDEHLMASALPKYLTLMDNLSFVPESGNDRMHYLANAADLPAREVMSRKVSRVELGANKLTVAHKMVHDGDPDVVITRNGRVAGIVDRLDLYAAIEELD